MHDFFLRQFAFTNHGGIKSRDAAGEFSAVEVADTDDVTDGKRTFATGDAGWQEAFAIFTQGEFGAVINKQCTFRIMKKGDPFLAMLKRSAASVASLFCKSRPYWNAAAYLGLVRYNPFYVFPHLAIPLTLVSRN